jgi:hypothetical protein
MRCQALAFSSLWAPAPNYRGKGLQLQFIIEDEGVFTMPWSATILSASVATDCVGTDGIQQRSLLDFTIGTVLRTVTVHFHGRSEVMPARNCGFILIGFCWISHQLQTDEAVWIVTLIITVSPNRKAICRRTLPVRIGRIGSIVAWRIMPMVPGNCFRGKREDSRARRSGGRQT